MTLLDHRGMSPLSLGEENSSSTSQKSFQINYCTKSMTEHRVETKALQAGGRNMCEKIDRSEGGKEGRGDRN